MKGNWERIEEGGVVSFKWNEKRKPLVPRLGRRQEEVEETTDPEADTGPGIAWSSAAQLFKNSTLQHILTLF